jgi:hypothetical protein
MYSLVAFEMGSRKFYKVHCLPLGIQLFPYLHDHCMLFLTHSGETIFDERLVFLHVSQAKALTAHIPD